MKIKYVAGFIFNSDSSKVALIRKIKPDWQKGLLNGIGGKVEDSESSFQAMSRELEEEAGVSVPAGLFGHYCSISGTNNDGSQFEVDFFYLKYDLSELATKTEESVEIYPVESVVSKSVRGVGNVPWLVALALDCMEGVHPPKSVIVTY